MEYGAIDLHTKESQIRIVTSEGRVVLDQRIATRGDRFTWLFGERRAMRILLERYRERVGGQHLELMGHEVVVADLNYGPMYGERTRRIKTDKRDVAALAEANRREIYGRRIACRQLSATCGDGCGSGVIWSACVAR